MKDDIQNLKGNIIEVFTDDNLVKEIFVTDIFKNSEGKILIQSSEGKIYSEEDINWNYSLTLGGCLIAWLLKNNYISDKDAFKYDGKYYELFWKYVDNSISLLNYQEINSGRKKKYFIILLRIAYRCVFHVRKG